MVVCRDRSEELHGIVAALRSKVVVGPTEVAPRRGGDRQPFFDQAKKVTHELQSTSDIVIKLTKLIRQRNVFDDHSAEIQDLSVVVKDKLGRLHGAVQELEGLKNQQKGWTETQSDRHSDTVVNTLKARLIGTTKDFKDVLQTRTESIKQVHDRRADFTAKSRTLMQLKYEQPVANAAALDLDGDEEEDDGGAGAQLVEQLMPQNNDYFQERTNQVHQLEGTIGELQEMFSEFARIVQEQDQLIIRIDDDVEQALMDVKGGESELLRNLARVSNNRWLILKVFGVLFFFILFFGIFILK